MPCIANSASMLAAALGAIAAQISGVDAHRAAQSRSNWFV
jgi:hypothetical protein